MTFLPPFLLALLLIAGIGLGPIFLPKPAPIPTPVAKKSAHSTTTTEISEYEIAYQKRERQLNLARRVSKAQPQSWLHQSRLALFHLDMARLSGNLMHYTHAQNALQRAFSIAPKGSGPFLHRASLSFSMHRLEDAKKDLQAIEPNAETLGMLGDIALHQGKYKSAANLYEQAQNKKDDHASRARLANHARWMGDYKKADSLYKQAEDALPRAQTRLRAWTYLQRGILQLEQGKLQQALIYYENANQLFSGWWLIEEHIAEIHALQNKTQTATTRYHALIKTTQNPAFMSALADVLEATNPTEAKRWSQQASKLYKERIQRWPEATSGHALDHFLSTDPKLALQLARKNHTWRPGGEATTLLLQTQLANGLHTEALQTATNLLSTPYRSAQMLVSAATAFSKNNQPERAKALMQQAKKYHINPASLRDLP